MRRWRREKWFAYETEMTEILPRIYYNITCMFCEDKHYKLRLFIVHCLHDRKFVAHFIDFPKPLIAAVNGPAVGISVTVMCLFDMVYATDKATFHTPFMELGQSPEGCSSFMFPRIMGPAKVLKFSS